MLTHLSIVLAALVMWVWLDHAAAQPALPTAEVGVAESGDRLLAGGAEQPAGEPIAVPVSLLTELPPQAIRAILWHELAHIRRHDYLLNLIQMLVESVLFFNPAIWWVSRQIRIEREACCDALAVRRTGEPIVYSQALAAWAEPLT